MIPGPGDYNSGPLHVLLMRLACPIQLLTNRSLTAFLRIAFFPE